MRQGGERRVVVSLSQQEGHCVTLPAAQLVLISPRFTELCTDCWTWIMHECVHMHLDHQVMSLWRRTCSQWSMFQLLLLFCYVQLCKRAESVSCRDRRCSSVILCWKVGLVSGLCGGSLVSSGGAVSSHCRRSWLQSEARLCGPAGLLEGHLLLIRIMMQTIIINTYWRQRQCQCACYFVSWCVDLAGSGWILSFKRENEQTFLKKMKKVFLFIRALIKWNCKTRQIFLSQETILFVYYIKLHLLVIFCWW